LVWLCGALAANRAAANEDASAVRETNFLEDLLSRNN
jgi:hypothetical protein